MHYDSDNLSFIFSFHDYRLQGVLDSFVCPDKIKMTKSIFYALKFRLQTSWILSTVYQAFFGHFEKTQGQKNSRISKNSRDFSENSRIFSKNSSFCQLLNFEIAAKKKLFFRGFAAPLPGNC